MNTKNILLKLKQKAEVKKAKAFIQSNQPTKPINNTDMKFFNNQAKAESDSLKSEIATLKKELAKATHAAISNHPKAKSATPPTPLASSIKHEVFTDTALAPMTRAEFNAMSSQGKSEFSKRGGRLK